MTIDFLAFFFVTCFFFTNCLCSVPLRSFIFVASDNSTGQSTNTSGGFFATAFAKLVANNTADNSANDSTLLVKFFFVSIWNLYIFTNFYCVWFLLDNSLIVIGYVCYLCLIS